MIGVNQIRQTAREVLENSPDGIRFGDLVKKVEEAWPDANLNTVRTTIHSMHGEGGVLRPSRGHWILERYVSADARPNGPPEEPIIPPPRADEQAFYEPFAEWLKNE